MGLLNRGDILLIQRRQNRQARDHKRNLLREIAPVFPMLSKQVRGVSTLKILVALAVWLPMLAGCATILESTVGKAINDSVDAVKCHNECPGGPGENECIEKCKKRLSNERTAEKRKREDAKSEPKSGHEYQPPKPPPALDPLQHPSRLKR